MPIGFHVSKTTTLEDGTTRTRTMPTALREDMQTLINYEFRPCAQIFVTGPQSFKETLTDDEKDEIRHIVDEMDLTLVVHGAYVDYPWKLASGAIHNIKQELRIAARIGANGVIVHLGRGCNDNLEHVLSKVSKLPADVLDNVTLWLEIQAAKPSSDTYETPEKIARLFDRIRKLKGIRVGLCIDTAHLFSCGMALIDNVTAVDWLSAVSEAVGEAPIMLHLNDSNSVLGSGEDVHAGLTLGNIWGIYNTGALPFEESGLAAVLTWADEHDILVILERAASLIVHDLAVVKAHGYFQN